MRTLQGILLLVLVILGACAGDSMGAVPVCSAASAAPLKLAVGAYVSVDPGMVAGCLTLGRERQGLPVTHRTASQEPKA